MKTKNKHTPGPWKFNINKTALLALNKDNEYVFIYNASPYNSMEPSSKDAALIAAAPEMLEMLETILNETDDAVWISKIESILNKAKGE